MYDARREDNNHTEDMKNKAAELFTCLNFAYHQQRAARRRSKMPLQQSPTTTNSPRTNTTKEELNKETITTATTTTITNTDSNNTNNSRPTSAGDTTIASSKERESCCNKDDKDTDRGALVKSESVESNCSSLSQSSCSQPSQRTAQVRTHVRYRHDHTHNDALPHID